VAEKYRTTREVAEYFRTSEATIRYWKHTGKIRGIKPGRRTLYPVSEIERIERMSADDRPEAG
jgi:excisionase family DNA binding protein